MPRRLAAILPALVVLAVVVARLGVKHPAGGFAHVVLAEELVAPLGALALVALAARGGRPVPRDGITVVVGALAVIEVVSTAFAPNPWIALRAASLQLAGAAAFFACRSLASPLRLPSVALLVPIAVVALSVLLEASGVVVGLSRGGHAPGGLLAERNSAAELLVLAAPLVATHALSGRRRTRALALATALLGAGAVVASRTRSAWLAAAFLVLGGMVHALRGTAGERRRAALLALALAIGVGLAPRVSTLRWASATPYVDTLTHWVDPASPSAHGRLVQYATTWRMATAHPVLGVGPGNWAGAYPSFATATDPTVGDGPWPTTRLPNSDLLGFLAERGFPAFALLVLLVALCVRRGGWRVTATLGAWLVMGSLDAVLTVPPHLLFVACVVGGSLGAAPQPVAGGLGARIRHAALALALGAAAFGALQRVRAFAIIVEPYGIEELERAARLDPGDVALRLVLAEDWIAAGRCDRAVPHLRTVRRYSPSAPMLQELTSESETCVPK